MECYQTSFDHVWAEAEFMNVQFRAISAHNLASSQTWGFRVQCLHNIPVSNHFWEGGAKNPLVEVTVNSKEERTLKIFVPITYKNSASGMDESCLMGFARALNQFSLRPIHVHIENKLCTWPPLSSNLFFYTVSWNDVEVRAHTLSYSVTCRASHNFKSSFSKVRGKTFLSF